MTPQQNRIDLHVESYHNAATAITNKNENNNDEEEDSDQYHHFDENVNATLVALEAAEDFVSDMDDAFAEFDSRNKYSTLEVVVEGEEEDEMTSTEEEGDDDQNKDEEVIEVIQVMDQMNLNSQSNEAGYGDDANVSAGKKNGSSSSASPMTQMNHNYGGGLGPVIAPGEIKDSISHQAATTAMNGNATATTTQQQEQGRGEVVIDTNWGDDDFFGFTDEEDDDSEELLVSPVNEHKQTISNIHNNSQNQHQLHPHHPPQNGIHHHDGQIQQHNQQGEEELSSPYVNVTSKPLPQDQPQQSSSINNNHENNYNHYDSQNNHKVHGQIMETTTNPNSMPTSTSMPMETITTTQYTTDFSNYENIYGSTSTETHETTPSSNRTDSSQNSNSTNDQKKNNNHNNHNNSSNSNNNHNHNQNDPNSNSKTKNTKPTTPASCAKTLDFMYVTQSNQDELVQSHAEDVLSLTLEIQNLKEKLKNERIEHAETKRCFEMEEEKSVQFEMNLQQLRADVRIMQEEHEKELQMQREESEGLRSKLEVAEEDAQQALDVAKDSHEKIKEMEELLQKSLDEVEQMRSQQQEQQQANNQLPMISEQYSQERQMTDQEYSSDTSNTSYETPQRARRRIPSISSASPYRRDRGASIGMGRNILRSVASASVADSDDLSSAASASTFGSMTSNSSYIATLTQRTAERRRKLRESMNRSSDGGPTGKEVVCFSSPNNQNGLDLGSGFIKTVKSVTKIIKDSGKRLNLGGRRFNASNSAIKSKRRGHSDSDDLDIEALARNYCKSVEALISKKREEVKELKQFCGFLEEKLK